MRSCFRYFRLAAACLAVVASGCQSADERPAEIASSASEAAIEPSAEAAEDPSPEPSAQAAAGESEPKELESPPPAAKAQFSPPFPDRLELFEPPKRAQSAARQNDVEGQSVELKGFVNVDKPRVLLDIDGVISPIAEGGEKYGVRVISIQPPNVVLERNRARWIATLE
jgi:hypothetical protein